MRLETEFRLRLQLMALEQAWEQPACSDRTHSDCGDSELLVPPLLPPMLADAGMWVKLRQAPGLFSSDEALLLCPLERDQWLAWVPDYGEITLDQDEFYLSGYEMD
jgi:hypothetical protein